jgi:cobalt/nickel transport system ATP-binding protein
MTDVLRVQDLHFSYHDGLSALRGVSFEMCEGDKVALVGPNGAGKSTLMLHLNGILNGRKGDVFVGGQRLTRDNLPAVRAMVGLVFQNPDDQLFSPTVFEDVAFGLLHMGLPMPEVESRVESALEASGPACSWPAWPWRPAPHAPSPPPATPTRRVQRSSSTPGTPMPAAES